MTAGQLSLGFTPAAAPGTWACGLCHCVRPEDRLWCSHLADHDKRAELHRLLDCCEDPTCAPAYPCQRCSELAIDAELPWPPAYRCLTCRGLPGERHAPSCDDAGKVVPSMAEQIDLNERAIEAAADADAACDSIPCQKGHRLSVPKGSQVPLAAQRCWCGAGLVGAPPVRPRKAPPSVIEAETSECETCGARPGARCRNYKGKGCAPHSARVAAAKAAAGRDDRDLDP